MPLGLLLLGRGARTLACRVETHLDASVRIGGSSLRETIRRDESRRGTQECVRHAGANRINSYFQTLHSHSAVEFAYSAVLGFEVAQAQTIAPIEVQRLNGSLIAFLRLWPRLLQSELHDGGLTWTPAHETNA